MWKTPHVGPLEESPAPLRAPTPPGAALYGLSSFLRKSTGPPFRSSTVDDDDDGDDGDDGDEDEDEDDDDDDSDDYAYVSCIIQYVLCYDTSHGLVCISRHGPLASSNGFQAWARVS